MRYAYSLLTSFEHSFVLKNISDRDTGAIPPAICKLTSARL